MKKQQGFTLLELLTVISIISLFANSAFAVAYTARVRARDARRFIDVKNFGKAVEFYYDDYGHYPCTTNGFEANPFMEAELVPKYIDKAIMDPVNKKHPQKLEYEYESFRTSLGGDCGQRAMIYFGVENQDPNFCASIGALSHQSDKYNHCHLMFPVNSLLNPSCEECAGGTSSGGNFQLWPSECCIGGSDKNTDGLSD